MVLLVTVTEPRAKMPPPLEESPAVELPEMVLFRMVSWPVENERIAPPPSIICRGLAAGEGQAVEGHVAGGAGDVEQPRVCPGR